jgi:hypothetical protein
MVGAAGSNQTAKVTTTKLNFNANTGSLGIGTTAPNGNLSFGTGLADNKIYLYDGTNDKYGFGVRASQFLIYSGAQGDVAGGITFGKYNGTTFTESVRITNSGNVGIGITAPLAKTHLVTTSTTTGMIIEPIYSGGGGGATAYGNSNVTLDEILLRTSYNENPEAVANAGHKWGIKFTGYNGSTVSGLNGKSAAIYAVSEDTAAGYNRQVGLSFFTAGFDLDMVERVRINNVGNVGVGTTAPSQLIEAVKSADADTVIQVTNSNSGNGATAQFFASNGTTKTQFFHTGTNYSGAGALNYAGLGGIYSNTAAGISIAAVDSAGTIKFASGGTAERARFASDGNLGIGTTSPGQKLTVVASSGDLVQFQNSVSFGTVIQINATATGGRNWKLQATANGDGTLGGGFFTIVDATANAYRLSINSTGDVLPGADATQDLGSTTKAWRNVYTNDLHLSNMGHERGNSVDGTRGNWTVQEGAEDLYLINNLTGRRYRFKLEEIQ